MLGKIEQENKIIVKIEDKLNKLPSVFTEFYNYMESEQKSYTTIKHYIEYVSDFMDFITSNSIDNEFYKKATVAEIREYIVSLRRRNDNGVDVKNSDSIQATRWSALNTFYNFLIMDDYMDVNPMNKTKRPKNKKQNEIVYLEQDEINTLINKIKSDTKNKMVNRDLAIIILGITTGVRVGALVQINIGDIDFKNNTIHVIEKGGKDRFLMFGSSARSALSQWIMDRNSYFEDLDTDALFISQYRQRITVEGIRKLFKKYTKYLGKHITPHTMRKSCATQAYMAGTDIKTIANMLGHNSINTTMRYAAAVDSKQEQMVNSLDNLF